MKKKIVLIILIVLFIFVMILLSNVLKQAENKEIPKENEVKTDEKKEEKVIKVTSKSFTEEVLESENKVLIDFYADWCGPCKVLAPRVEEFAKENEDIKVVKIDIDKEQELALEYDVMSIPTLVVIENGKEVNRAIGLLPKTEIEKLVK